jgi:hypothetical protein
MKKAFVSFLATCLLLTILIPAPVKSAEGISIVGSSAEMDFPLSLIFKISAKSDAEITDVRLHYKVERWEHANITSEIYVHVNPSTSITTQTVWDMRKTGGLPPGSSVAYWWTLADAAGGTLKTAISRVFVEDNRYDWMKTTEGKVTLYWYRGSDFFVQELMSATQSALARLSENSGAELERPVSIYIYANASDLRGSMIYPQEWTGGVAFTRYGTIAIGIQPNIEAMEWGKRVIAHELTHLVIHQVTFNPYSGLPTWLDEGLAMVSEGPLESSFSSVLYRAREGNKLLTVRSLASPFSAYIEESSVSYAQSHQIVSFLIDEYGREKMYELLSTFRQGAGYDEALDKVYGFDMDGLNTLWRASFTEGQVQ